MQRHLSHVAGVALALILGACTPPSRPEEERRPDPQATAAPARHSAIVEYADGYKDRARAVEGEQLEAADRQRAAIDAATQ